MPRRILRVLGVSAGSCNGSVGVGSSFPGKGVLLMLLLNWPFGDGRVDFRH